MILGTHCLPASIWEAMASNLVKAWMSSGFFPVTAYISLHLQGPFLCLLRLLIPIYKLARLNIDKINFWWVTLHELKLNSIYFNFHQIFTLILPDCEYIKIIYVNCGSCNEYESNLCSNENYWTPSSSEFKGLEDLCRGQIKASIEMAWY